MNPHTIWPAPAKLNLLLKITGQRADGYHELQTVFQFLDIADKLQFQPRTDNQILLSSKLISVPDEDNLVFKAARLLQKTTGCTQGASIQLDKKLPMGGGLGGGSSDAATTLLALNKLWHTGLSHTTLAALGLQLGADVPIFIHGHAAWAEGIGEKITNIILPEPCFLVIYPGVQVSTQEVFSDFDLTRDAKPITIRDFLAGQTENDCLPVVKKRYPAVQQALSWLNQHAKARLTGTGACIFAAFNNQQEAENVLKNRPKGYDGFIAHGRNRSPVLDYL